MDEYNISDLPSRFLNTKHYQSSMEQPNLNNVQAKLNVARQRNHELAMSYFRQKYGSAAAYQQFAKKHNMGEIPKQQISQQQMLIRHLQKKARQIQMNFHNEDPFQQQNQMQQNQDIKKWIHSHDKKPSNNNPWIRQNKNNEKHKRNDTESSKFVDSALAPKNKQTQFISQFKHYLQNKQRHKQEQKNPYQNAQNQASRTYQSKMFSPSKIINKSVISAAESKKDKDHQKQGKKCYEQELAKKIYKDITGSIKDDASTEKLHLIEYILKNKKILKVLGLTQADLNYKIMKQYQTKSQNQITVQQFAFFILKTVGKQKQINQLKQEKRSKDVPEGCMLNKETIVHFQKIFKQMDTHTDLIIKRLPFIDRLANDPLVKNQINSPAVLQPDMQKPITLRRVFERIQMQCLFGTQEQQKIKQYISWNQFLDYFRSGYSSQSLYNMISLIDSLHKSDAMGLVEVPQIVMQIIAQTAPKSSSKSGYLNILSLIQNISKHPEFEHEKYTQVRQQSKISELPAQTFQEILSRIKQSGQKFMSLKQFLQYFSFKGRPIQQFQHNKNNSARKNFSGMKVKFMADQVTQKQEGLDGYDSDPQIYQSKIINKNSPRRSARSNKKLQNTISLVQQTKNNPINRNTFKITVPAPFSFEQREKQREKQKEQKLNEQKARQLLEQKFKHFHALPVPQKVKQQGLYQKMLQQDKKRNQDRRKSCMIMTLANQQPFSFMTRKTQKKNKVQREHFVFKANPIPWYCSVNLLTKKAEAQIVRNQKIAKQAQQNLAKAKLPPRMERDFQQKQAKMAMTEHHVKRPQSKLKAYREPPDFDKLHRQFQQGLQRKRKQNKITKPQQFNFTNKSGSRPKTANPNHTQQLPKQNQIKSGEEYKKIFETKPAAASTAKFQQQVQKRRQQMQKKRKDEQKKKIQDQKIKQINQNLKNKLLAATTKNKQNKQKQQKQKRQNQMKQQMKNFQNWKKQCVQKGRNQPMLVERPLKRDQKIQKMKKLHQISIKLKGNGIKGKQHDSYFNKQQLLMLQDWEVLKDKL